MTPRRRRLMLVLAIVAGVSVAGALALSAFRQNVMFFFDPTQVAAGAGAAGRALSAWRHGQEGQSGARTRQPRGAFRGDGFQPRGAVQLRPAYCRICFAKGRASSPMAVSRAMAPSLPTRCSPNTMRNTCRPRSPAPSSAVTVSRAPLSRPRRVVAEAPARAAGARTLRSDPRAAAGGAAGVLWHRWPRAADASAGWPR